MAQIEQPGQITVNYKGVAPRQHKNADCLHVLAGDIYYKVKSNHVHYPLKLVQIIILSQTEDIQNPGHGISLGPNSTGNGYSGTQASTIFAFS